MELPFKCNPENFKNIYRELYKGQITHEFIRNSLGLSEEVRLKLNGTFPRWLYLLDENDCLYGVKYRIQTALWFNNALDKWQYVSIFPNFIKRWRQPSLHMLEYIGCTTERGEDALAHIDDPGEILLCEDRIVKNIRQLERDCSRVNCQALLNSRYVHVFNKSLPAVGFDKINTKRFTLIYSLVLTARYFFGIKEGVLALVNAIIRL